MGVGGGANGVLGAIIQRQLLMGQGGWGSARGLREVGGSYLLNLYATRFTCKVTLGGLQIGKYIYMSIVKIKTT